MNRPKHNRWLLTLFLVCAIILSLPLPKANAQNFVNNRFNVVVVLDASGSMKNTDPNGLRYEAISQFFGLLAAQGNALGGVVFHTELAAEETLTEITDQSGKDTVMDMLKSIPSNGGWTNTGAGLARAVEMIKQDGAADLPSVILFLSDGNTAMASKEETQASLDQKAEALQAAREQGIQIYSVCLNANKSADVSEMQQLADATGGVFREVTKAEDLQDVFNTFYDLIYGTSTITIVEDVLPDTGRLETPFEVPGIGVEEVNIIVYGNTTKLSLLKPDGSEGAAAAVRSKTFSLLKLTDVESGMWTLITEGVPGDSIKVNMVYNTNLGIELSIAPEEKIINPADFVTITARLKGNDVLASNGGQYVGYAADLHVLDAYGELLESISMEVVDDRFEVKRTFQEGTYYYTAVVTGNYIEKESEKVGPLISSADALTEEEQNNTPPVPVNPVIEETVKIWPFTGGGFTLDMNELATDAQDSTLRYKIESTSFIEGTDYTVDNNGILTMEHFSLSKGSFTISATDSGGLSCEINVIVKSINIGLITLIGMGILALVTAVIFAILLYIAITKPFRGTISAQSYCNGVYRGTPRNPKRGREKLARFGMDNVGLDYQKSYFQATGQNYIFLVTDKEVFYNGQSTKKVRIQSGAAVTIYTNRDSTCSINIRFDSRVQGVSRRSAPRGGHRPAQPRRR